jgi:hypothetical protein
VVSTAAADMRGAAAALVVALALGACSIASVETPDPAAIPSGSLVPLAEDATGPVVELGSGQAEGLGWRYSIYPSGDTWCTQMEMAASTASGCGDLLPAGDAAFGSVAVETMDPGSVRVVEGLASEATFTVWLVENESQRRFPATLMPLDPAGLDGVAFVGIPPAEMNPTHVQAMARSGEILQTYELP